MAELDGCAKVRELQLSQIDIAHQQDVLWLQISARCKVKGMLKDILADECLWFDIIKKI
jgi:hypothetical protein